MPKLKVHTISALINPNQLRVENALDTLWETYLKEQKKPNVSYLEKVAMLTEIMKVTNCYKNAGYNVENYLRRCDETHIDLRNKNCIKGETRDIADKIFRRDPTIKVSFYQL